MLRDDEPDRSDEVGEDEDEEDEAEHTEDVHQVDLVHDLVVIFGHWLQFVVLLDSTIDTTTIEALEQTLEFLRIQKEEHFIETEESQQVEQIKLILRPGVLEDLVEEDARDGEQVDEEVALQVSLSNALEVAHAPLATLFVIPILHEEMADDVNAEAHLHDNVDYFGKCGLWWSKASVERG